MTVTKHYENNHVMLYVEEGEDLRECIHLENDHQIRRLGQCLIDLDRTEGTRVKIEERKISR